MKIKMLLCLGAILAAQTNVSAQLWVDFNSTSQNSGPHPQAAYESYDAGHEVTADFVTQSYSAFAGTIGVTPAWPNTTDNRVQQMIDRGDGNDAQWLGSDLDLVTDFLGIDSRTGNGGNGDWNRSDDATSPTYMTLSLSGLPAGDYNWKSFHHDTENVWADFQVELSTDGGANYAAVGDFEMSSSSTGGNPANAGLITTDPVSMVETGISATGDDVVFRFATFADGVDASAVHKQIFGINGFQLSAVPEPGANVMLVTAFVALLAIRRRR